MTTTVASYIEHIAGAPHEGTQACTRCGRVLREEPEPDSTLGPVKPVAWWRVGATVSVGMGGMAAVKMMGGKPCR